MRNDPPFNVMPHSNWERAPRIEAIATYLLTNTAITSTFLAYAIAYVGVTAVTSWALRALTPDMSGGMAGGGEGGLLTNARGATNAQQLIYGEVRKGGTITYMESNGTNNEYLHQIICLAGHEVNSIGQIYINDQAVTLDGSGNVTSAEWVDADSNPVILIQKFTGAANQNVYTTLNGLTNGPTWQGKETGDDTNFRGQGIACLYVRLKFNQDVFAQGVPLFTAKVQGKKVVDPRSSSTAYSANAALCIRDYLVSKYGLDNSGVTNDTVFSAAANTCDEDVSLAAGGTEKRYEINGVISLDRTPADILADMMTACAGTLFWGVGQWQLKVGEYTSSVKTLTLDDLRSPITLDTKHSRRDNFNIVRGTFVDASEDYIRADYPEIKSSTFISNDNNIESALDLSLPLTTSSTMAQRLAKMTLFRAREQMTLTADFGMEAFEVQVGDVIGITNARYGFSNKDFEVVGWKFGNDNDDGALTVGLTLRETSSSAFNWSAEESSLSNNDSTLPSLSNNLTISSLTTSGGGRTTSDGTFVNSVIVSWSAPSNPFISHYEVEHRASADSSFAATITSETSIELTPLVDGVEYFIRVRAVTVSGNKGPFVTATFTGGGDTTAPALPTSISATGGFRYITINWTNPADADLNFVEVYENTTNTSSGATKVGVSSGSSFVRTNLGLNQTRFYFLKSVDYSGNASAFTTGVSATTTYLDDPDFENGIRQIFIDGGLDLIEPVSSLPASGDFTGQTVFLTSENKLYNWTGSSWNAAAGGANSFSELSGSIAASQIPSGTITEAKLADDSVTAAKISANAIGANEIASGAVTADKIAAGVISGDKIVANTITGGLLATSGIITSAAQISNAVITATQIADAAITNAKIGSLDAAKITAGTLDVERFPALGQANSTTLTNLNITRNSSATASVSFSGVKSGAKLIVVASLRNAASNIEAPFINVTPTGTNVTLNNSVTQRIKGLEGSETFTKSDHYPMVLSGTTTSTSGSVGFTIEQKGNDSGSGNTNGTIVALILSG